MIRTVFAFVVWVLFVSQSSIAQVQLRTSFTAEFQAYTTVQQSIRAAFTIRAPGVAQRRAPLSLTMVLDISNSMSGRPLQLLKRTAQFFVRKLAENNGVHALGIIAYQTRVFEISPVVTVDASSAPALIGAIERLAAGGTTFLSGGLNTGVQQQISLAGTRVKNVFLFTDGRPTEGPTSVSGVIGALNGVLRQSNQRITISTFGFGRELDTRLLTAIARAGGGQTYIITQEQQIPAAFGKALGGLLSIVAAQVEVVLRSLPGCQIASVQSGGSERQGTGTYTLRFNNLFATESRDMVLTINIAAGIAGVLQCIQAAVSFTDVFTDRRRSTPPQILQIARVANVQQRGAPSSVVEGASVRFSVAARLELAQESVEAGNTQQAAQLVSEAQGFVQNSPLASTPELQDLSADVNTALTTVQSGTEDPTDTISSLNTLGTALQLQRSVSTTDEFQTDVRFQTEEQEIVQQETIDAVIPPTEREGMPTMNEQQDTDPTSNTDPTISPSPSPMEIDDMDPDPTDNTGPAISPIPSPIGIDDMDPDPTDNTGSTISPSPSPIGIDDMDPDPTDNTGPTISPSPSPIGIDDMDPDPIGNTGPTISPSPSPIGIGDVDPDPTNIFGPTISPSPSPIGIDDQTGIQSTMDLVDPALMMSPSPSILLPQEGEMMDPNSGQPLILEDDNDQDSFENDQNTDGGDAGFFGNGGG